MNKLSGILCMGMGIAVLVGNAFAGTVPAPPEGSNQVAVKAAADFGVTVRDFSAARFKLEQELASKLKLEVPSQAEAFFRAAVAGEWAAVSNQFALVLEQGDHGPPIAGLQNELWSPVHETFGIWEVWENWKHDSALLAMFHESVLASMPKGSIYFGGTDSGRFVITTVNALRKPSPVYCVTQNALADMKYAAHLLAVYGDQVWMPSQEDCTMAFQNYVRDVQSGKRPANSSIKIKDGRVSVEGVAGVMEINGLICRMIFDENKDSHEFFVEESYVIPWMNPFLEPHGLIMKLNREPVERFTRELIDRDSATWQGTVAKLESHPGFAANTEARKAFAKLRCAIAGLYVYRKLIPQAEAAFRQALRLCPASPEASYRLAKMYEEHGRATEALEVMKAFLKICQPSEKTAAGTYLEQLKSQRR